jgi:phage gp46-like protein
VDNLLDPTTGDYTGTSTSSLANAVYLRLMIPLGSGGLSLMSVQSCIYSGEKKM